MQNLDQGQAVLSALWGGSCPQLRWEGVPAFGNKLLPFHVDHHSSASVWWVGGSEEDACSENKFGDRVGTKN